MLATAASQYFDAQDTLSQTNTLLSQVTRVLNPIKDLNLSACLRIDTTRSEFTPIISKLGKLLDPTTDVENMKYVSRGSDPTPWLVIHDLESFFSDTSLFNFNQTSEYGLAKHEMTLIPILVSFSETQKPIQDIMGVESKNLSTFYSSSDLRAGFSSGHFDNENRFYPKDQMIYHDGKLLILIQNSESDTKYWSSTGKIKSITDLRNSLLTIKINTTRYKDIQIQPSLIYDLQYITLNMTDGRNFSINDFNSNRTSNEHSEPLYFYRFPSEEDRFPAPTVSCD